MKLGIVAWLELDDAMFSSEEQDPESWEWLIHCVLLGERADSEPLSLFSQEIGDEVGQLHIETVGLWKTLPRP